jgi:hypothetical protein
VPVGTILEGVRRGGAKHTAVVIEGGLHSNRERSDLRLALGSCCRRTKRNCRKRLDLLVRADWRQVYPPEYVQKGVGGDVPGGWCPV